MQTFAFEQGAPPAAVAEPLFLIRSLCVVKSMDISAAPCASTVAWLRACGAHPRRRAGGGRRGGPASDRQLSPVNFRRYALHPRGRIARRALLPRPPRPPPPASVCLRQSLDAPSAARPGYVLSRGSLCPQARRFPRRSASRATSSAPRPPLPSSRPRRRSPPCAAVPSPPPPSDRARPKIFRRMIIPCLVIPCLVALRQLDARVLQTALWSALAAPAGSSRSCEPRYSRPRSRPRARASSGHVPPRYELLFRSN
jgi:hypothetical protein